MSTPSQYLNQLDNHLQTKLNELTQQISGNKNPNIQAPNMQKLLMSALKNEWETTLITCQWLINEVDADLRIHLARLAGDEAKHFSLIENRLNELGGKKNIEELNLRSPLYHYLIKQEKTLDRVITGPYAREAVAVMRNEVFINHCKQINDTQTSEIYLEIQKDESYHHQIGKKFLTPYLTNDEQFKYAQNKISEVLNLIEEIQEAALLKIGKCLPGC